MPGYKHFTFKAIREFSLYCILGQRSTKAKAKLTADELRAFQKVALPVRSGIWHARNAFMFSFFCGGMRIGDVLAFQWRNIIGDRLMYGMEKTNAGRSMPLLAPARELLKQYVYNPVWLELCIHCVYPLQRRPTLTLAPINKSKRKAFRIRSKLHAY